MGKRHQASRRKAYGRRQHELRERFDRGGVRDGEPSSMDAYEVAGYDHAVGSFGSFDPAVAGGLRYALRD